MAHWPSFGFSALKPLNIDMEREEMEEDTSPKIEYYATVRHGAMGYVIKCSTQTAGLRPHDPVVLRTERGVESGVVVCQEGCCSAGEETPSNVGGEILRRMTPDDLGAQEAIAGQNEPAEFRFCQERIAERKLPMKLASVEHLLGGTKIIFYFLADGRVDFRELVKDLAQEYHCRIEMRQIGVRDEARLLADYEHCGRPLCCRTFVKKLEPVSMKMAKSQKATLDPAKISGRCGRLMCCLRFEDETYEELKRSLPRKGTKVKTPEGAGVVIDQEVLGQTVTVDLGEGKRAVCGAQDLERMSSSANQGGKRRRRNPQNSEASQKKDQKEGGQDNSKP